MKYSELLNSTIEKLSDAGVADAKVDAWLLMEHFLDIDRNFYYLHMADEMQDFDRKAFDEAVEKRCKKIPLQHITGSQVFMGLDFKVDDTTLIPRQDTESLVEETLNLVKQGDFILDMCTGTGCILLSILYNSDYTKGVGADISKGAISLAKENAVSLGLDGRSRFFDSNLFEGLEDFKGCFDILVSNPPYINTDEINNLMPEVRDHEPMAALDGGVDGLDFYRIIIEKSRDYLKKDGWLLFEIGYDQGESVPAIMEKHGYKSIRIIKDLAGNDRVVLGQLKD